MKDDTFKIFKEGLVMQTFSTVDIAQHGKLIALGPSSHEDAEANEVGGGLLKQWTDNLISNIKNHTLPSTWSEAVKDEIYNSYGHFLEANPQIVEYNPGGKVSDLAKAIKNGLPAAIPSVKSREKDCYTHTWRAMGNHKNKLQDSSKEVFDEVISDIAFLREVFDSELLWTEVPSDEGSSTDDATQHIDGPIYKLFKNKWSKEPIFLQYLVEYHLYNKWHRCWGPDAEPVDTNTLEREHQTLKGVPFPTMQGAGNVMESLVPVGRGLSLSTSPMAEVPNVTADTWVKAQELIKSGWPNLVMKVALR